MPPIDDLPPDGAEPAPLRPTGTYRAPAMPAEDAVRSLWTRLKQLLRRGEPEDAPRIAEDRLQHAAGDLLDALAPAPDCGPLQRELDAALADWAAGRPPAGPAGADAARVQLLVLPPGDADVDGAGGGVVAAWARRHDLDVLPDPDRDALTRGDVPDLSAVGELGTGPLVVPRLERWFLRRHDGLTAARALLGAADRSGRPLLIGCNSWAWAFLSKAADANMTLPGGRTFAAFDAARLRSWFRELAAGGQRGAVSFRLTATGRPVLDGDGEPADNYFRTLAAHSLGVPWVAWHLWRRSLRSEKTSGETSRPAAGGAGDAEAPAERKTLWVTALEEFTLPTRHEPGALLILQALLIHGRLTADELRGVIPATPTAALLAALTGAGFVRRGGAGFEELSVAPAAYPAVRAGLSAAGFPVDKL